MKEIEEIPLSPIRMSYYYDSEFSPEPVKDIIDFFNQYATMGDIIHLDVYLNTPGGNLPDFNTIKTLFERSAFKITLINSFEVSSYGFYLFYACKNVTKLLLPHSTAMLHTISAPFEDRDIRKNDKNLRIKHQLLDGANEEFLSMVKKNKILSNSDYKRLEKGEDIVILYEELHKMMLRCPYGNYINN